jgi:hypothetical protein
VPWWLSQEPRCTKTMGNRWFPVNKRLETENVNILLSKKPKIQPRSVRLQMEKAK